MKRIKKFNENSSFIENEQENIEPLTIQEFSLLRECMYAVKTSNSPSAYQAKEFFSDNDNFEKVVEKLRKMLF